MSNPISPDDLEDIPLLAGLSSEDRQQLIEIAHCGEYPPGHLLLEQGKQSQRLWIILEGTCEVLLEQSQGKGNGKPIALATLERHNTFGEMSFFNSAPHSASVRSKTPVKLLYIDRKDFDRLCHEKPGLVCKVSVNTLNMLSARMRRMDTWVAELVQQDQRAKPIGEWAQLRDKLFDWKL